VKVIRGSATIVRVAATAARDHVRSTPDRETVRRLGVDVRVVRSKLVRTFVACTGTMLSGGSASSGVCQRRLGGNTFTSNKCDS
jgi:hypothetical protein